MGEPEVEVLRHIKAEFRDPGYSWKEYTIDVFSNGNITYHLGRQVEHTFDSFKDIKFYKVNPNDNIINVRVEEWEECKNLEYMTFAELDEKFKI